ncbi:hypothetical protein CPB83DRAFT_938026 [Crepidotus variabilis]|uniref:Uncharacterized protein n=1 Tax=Crepidotus variabilis TaxID=179855 RepID=A0A9P6ECH9_9AGAR|nr:hypothetical protein CPB83DRAFT_938026 [Crepidotus variabilis]
MLPVVATISIAAKNAKSQTGNCINCKSRTSFETPPSLDSRRAIVFEVNGEIKFTWVTVKQETDGEPIDEDHPNLTWEVPVGLEHYFHGNSPSHEAFHTNAVRRRTLKELIDLRINDNFQSDGSPKNLAVCRVVNEMDYGEKTWRDPLVALKKKGSWLDDKRLNPNPAAGYGLWIWAISGRLSTT